MTSKEAFNKLQHYINGTKLSGEEYLECCKILDKDLEQLEKLEKVFSDLKSMFDIKIGIDLGNEYFIEIKQLDTRIAELIIPQEDKEIFKEVFEYDK